MSGWFLRKVLSIAPSRAPSPPPNRFQKSTVCPVPAMETAPQPVTANPPSAVAAPYRKRRRLMGCANRCPEVSCRPDIPFPLSRPLTRFLNLPVVDRFSSTRTALLGALPFPRRSYYSIWRQSCCSAQYPLDEVVLSASPVRPLSRSVRRFPPTLSGILPRPALEKCHPGANR